MDPIFDPANSRELERLEKKRLIVYFVVSAIFIFWAVGILCFVHLLPWWGWVIPPIVCLVGAAWVDSYGGRFFLGSYDE